MNDEARLIRLETIWQDIRYALRGLLHNPAFAVTAILSLALGIGASMAIFTVADNFLVRPLPYPSASQLVMLWEAKGNQQQNVVSAGNYLDWQTQSTVFESVAAYQDFHNALSDGDKSEELGEQLISANLLPTLGVQAYRGRLFEARDDTRHGPQVALISYRLWQRFFGGNEGVIGRAVQIGGTPVTIVGVLPPGFYFRNRSADLWQPLGLDPAQDYRQWQGRWLLSVARMKPGVTRARAQAEMTGIAKRLEAAYPSFNHDWTVNVEPLRDSLVREVRTSLLMLIGAVVLLLAVACSNVASLLLTRNTIRQKEMAVRAALGARRGRIIRQLLTESVILGMVGGVLGTAIAWWAVYILTAFAPKSLTQSIEVVFDLRIGLVAAALSILTGIIFGLAPSLVASGASLTKSLHDDTRSSTGSGSLLRSWLVAGEVAATVILLTGAGLFFRSLVGLQAVDPGLNPSGLLTFRVSLPFAHYGQPAQTVQFFERAIRQCQQMPGVKAVSAISHLPFNGLAADTTVGIVGRPPDRPGEEPRATIRSVMPGYFDTMGIPLKSGRDFTSIDNTTDSSYRFIVNQAFVRRYLARDYPLGRQISVVLGRETPLGDIIGVAGDVKEGALDKDPTPTVYFSQAHHSFHTMIMVVRTAGDPLALSEPARKVILSIDSQQAIADVRTMDMVVAETLVRQKFSTVLLSGFSISSLLLAIVGIYGVVAYSVTQRTREIGVRVAVGAEPLRILSMIVGGGARLVLAGAAVGAAGAWIVSGLIRSMLFQISPRDPLTFILAPSLLILVALVAAYIPARRAARIAPMEALRME